MEKYLNLSGRILVAVLFLMAGFGKIGSYAATQGYMESMGVPGVLLPIVILLEAGGGLALVLGIFTRWVAIALAGFSLLSAFIFHANLADQIQMIMFLKNLAIAGGLLVIAAQDVKQTLSLDQRRLVSAG